MLEKIKTYPLGKDRKKDFNLFFIAFLLFVAFGLFFQFKNEEGFYKADPYVTTLLAFSYFKNGFIRRGLVGTIFDLICQLIPSCYCYQGAIWFMWAINLIYFISLLAFTKWVFDKIEDEKIYRGAYFFAMICFAFMIPTVCYWGGAFGRADVMQIAICLLQIYLLIENKFEWSTLLFTAINTLFHEGYVLMTFCTVVIVIIYKALYTKDKHLKYWILLILNMAVCAFVAVKSLQGGGSIDHVESYEKGLLASQILNKGGFLGDIHYNLLYMMAGYMPEAAPVSADAYFISQGQKELPIFLVCFIPVFYLLFKGYFQMFKQAGKDHLIIHIISLIIGPALIGVEFVKYCDYGRYVYWLAFYFFIVFMAFSALGDKGAKGAFEKAYSFSNIVAIIIICFMMPYQPLPTCNYTHLSRFILVKFFSK